MHQGGSFTWRRNGIGPKIEPCRTPDVTVVSGKLVPITL